MQPMPWYRQVRHVLLHDIRDTRLLLAAYAILVALGIAEVLASEAWPIKLGQSGMFIMRGVLALIGATIVLRDPPANPKVIGGSLPLARTAVFTAKTLIMCALLAVTAVALAIMFSSYTVMIDELVRLTASSLLPYATWSAATLVVAAVSRDMRSFLVRMLAFVPIAIVLLLVIMWGPSMAISAPSPMLLQLLWLLVLLAALIGVWFMYRNRHASRPARAIATGVGMLLIAAPVVMRPPNRRPSPLPPTSIGNVSANIVRDTSGRSDQEFFLRLQTQALPDHLRAQWSSDRVVLDRSGGDFDLTSMAFGDDVLFTPQLPMLSAFTWLHPDDAREAATRRRSAPTESMVSLPRMQRGDAIQVAGQRVVIEGRLLLSEPRITRHPMKLGPLLTANGLRLSLTQLVLEEDAPMIQISMTGVHANDKFPAIDAFIVNQQRNEAVRLNGVSSSSSFVPLMLSPSAVILITERFRANYAGITDAGWESWGVPRPRIDAEWILGATLVLVEWVPVSAVPVTVVHEAAAGL